MWISAILLTCGVHPASVLAVPGHLADDRDRSTIKVLVLGTDGQPVAGVPVGWDQPGIWLGSESHQVRTDQDGRAVLTTMSKAEFRLLAHDVGLAFPHLEDVRAFVPANQGADEPVVLRMPPTRRVEVWVVDELGGAVEGLGGIELGLRTADQTVSDSACLHQFAPISGGRAVFSWVGHGRLTLSGSVGTRRLSTFHGPESDAEILVDSAGLTSVKVRAGPGGAMLRGRLLFPDGTPVSDREVHFQTCWFGLIPGQLVRLASVRSGSDGRIGAAVFRLDKTSGTATKRPGETSLWVALTIADEFGGTHYFALIHLNELEPPEGPFEIGDVVLTESTLLAAGRVIDDRGQPVAGAEISCREVPTVASTPVGAPFQPAIASERVLWKLPQARRTREDGSFELRRSGADPAGNVELQVQATTWEQRQPTCVPVGTRGVELRQPRAGRIATRVELPEGIRFESIGAFVVPAGDGMSTPRVHPIRFADDLDFDRLPAGRFDLVISTLNALPAHAEVLRIAGLEVRCGEECDDPRLESVSLRPWMELRELTILAPDRYPVACGFLYSGDVPPRHRNFNFPIEDGRCMVPIARACRERLVAEIVTPEFATKVIYSADLDSEIVLEHDRD